MSDDYEVGYGKPPKEHQFKKGQSGNPRGRPPKKHLFPKRMLNPVWEVVAGVMGEPMSMSVDGEVRQVSRLYAFIRKLHNEALQGKTSSSRLLGQLVSDMGEHVANDRLRVFQFVEEYKNKVGTQFARAREERRPEPQFLPHPDHVDFSMESLDVVIAGPETSAQKAEWDFLKRTLRRLDDQREALLAKRDIGGLSVAEQQEVADLDKMIRQLEKSRVPPFWNWREGVTDEDRAYYERSAKG